MAKGKTHDKITITLTPLVVVIFLIINRSFLNSLGDIITYTILGLSIYIFGGYMFSGDLDIISNEYNRWGYLKYIWIPYQKIFSHRSIFTHGFILGPVIRLLYLYSIGLFICSILYSFSIITMSTSQIIEFTKLFVSINKILCFNVFFGLFLGSGVHTITDLIYSFTKRNFIIKKRRKKSKRTFFKRLVYFSR